MITASTPGPWRWELNPKSKCVRLCGGKPRFDLTVMDFVRWGIGGAAPRFVSGLLTRCDTMGVIVPGREHHAAWFQGLSHPDADLIARAPDLLAENESLRAELYIARGEIDALRRAAQP